LKKIEHINTVAEIYIKHSAKLPSPISVIVMGTLFDCNYFFFYCSQDDESLNSIQPIRGSFHGSFPRRVRTRSDRGMSTHANTYQRRRLLTIAKTKSLPA